MAIIYATWDPDDKHANIILSNGNLTAVSAGSWIAVRSSIGKSSGKWYWEITVQAVGAELNGIATPAAPLDAFLGSSAVAHLYRSNSGATHCGGSGGSVLSTYTSGDVIGIAFDMDNNRIWFAKNGVWQDSGDPANNTNPVCSNLSGTVHAVWNPGASGLQVTANFGASAFSYSVPSGFSSGFYSGTPIEFTFTNPIPAHLSTVYGTTEQVCLTTTISGEEPNYVYDAAFYDGFDVQIGTTVSGIQSGQFAESNEYLSTPSGIDYSWYMTATTSGEEDTGGLYTFTNAFLCEGATEVNNVSVSGIPVRLYRRSTGEYIGGTNSAGVSGTFEIESSFNEYHYVVGLYNSDDTNALIYDWIKPEE